MPQLDFEILESLGITFVAVKDAANTYTNLTLTHTRALASLLNPIMTSPFTSSSSGKLDIHKPLAFILWGPIFKRI